MAGGTVAAGGLGLGSGGPNFIDRLMDAFGLRDAAQPASGTGAFLNPGMDTAPSVGPAVAPPANVAGVQGGPGSQSGGADPAGQPSPVRQFVSEMAQKIRATAANAVNPETMPSPTQPLQPGVGAAGMPGAVGSPAGPAASNPHALQDTAVSRAVSGGAQSVRDTINQVAQAQSLQQSVQGALPAGETPTAGGGMAAQAAPASGPAPMTPPTGTTLGMPQGGPSHPAMEKLQQAMAAAKVRQDVNGAGNMNATPLAEKLPWAGGGAGTGADAPAAPAKPTGLKTPFGTITGDDVREYIKAVGRGVGELPGSDQSGGANLLRGFGGAIRAGDQQEAVAAASKQQGLKNDLASKKDAREAKSASYKNAQILSSVMAKMSPTATLTQRVGVSKALTNYMNARAAQGVVGDALQKEVEAERQRIMADPGAMQQPSLLMDDGTATNDTDSTAPPGAQPTAPKTAKTKGPKGSLGPASGYPEGQTATGKNGEKIVVRGGYWVPAQ